MTSNQYARLYQLESAYHATMARVYLLRVKDDAGLAAYHQSEAARCSQQARRLCGIEG